MLLKFVLSSVENIFMMSNMCDIEDLSKSKFIFCIKIVVDETISACGPFRSCSGPFHPITGEL